MSTWETSSADPTSKFRGTLVARASKRTGYIDGDRAWVVEGDPKLGDHYTQYHIDLPPVPNGEKPRYRCTCQGHAGGEYRKICSHILFVILARRGKLEFAGSLTPIEQHPIPALPVTEEPPFPPRSEEAPSNISSREWIDGHFRDWGGIQLPRWLTALRPHQWEAVQEIERLFLSGTRVVFLDAPTGAGKTLIAELVRRRISSKRAVYTCSTKTLQDQFAEDYPYANVIKGRANYETLNFPERWPQLSAELCDLGGGVCTMCHEPDYCPYQRAKRAARKGAVAVANVAYLLTIQNFQDDFTGEPFVIIDEADTLEGELMRFVEFSLSHRQLKKYDLSPPEKKTVADVWIEWVRETAWPKILRELDRFIGDSADWSPEEKKEHARLTSWRWKLRIIGGWDYESNGWDPDYTMDNWVYTDYDRGGVTFKPVRVGEFARPYLWDHGQKFLLMSATIISAEQMAQDLDLEEDEWASVTIGSTFDPERRPIYVEPIAEMTYRTRETAWPKMVARITEIIEAHPDDKILIHSVSYKFTEFIIENVADRSRIISYRSAREREAALKKFRKSKNGVVVAASFDRGVDLPQDECRVVIIPKIPYPNLSDRQISRRLHSRGGQGWYSMQTVRTLVQMCGRAMRSEDDWCEIYLLDRMFNKIQKKNRRMLPKWWRDALVTRKGNMQ